MPLDGEPSTRVKKSGLAVLVTMDERNRGILEGLVVALDLNGRGQRAHLRGRWKLDRGPGPSRGLPHPPRTLSLLTCHGRAVTGL